MRSLKHITSLLLICTGILCSCSKPKVEVPANIIPADTMVRILTDMHLVEAAIQMRNLSGHDSLHTEAFGRYKFVMEKYKISREQFEKSFRWYSSEPQLFARMYDSVIVHLSEGQAKAQSGQ
ncbi:MAG: DUF4296 domain-containing protein [Bacteroidia bacterium]